jgi:hypothetical protein
VQGDQKWMVDVRFEDVALGHYMLKMCENIKIQAVRKNDCKN